MLQNKTQSLKISYIFNNFKRKRMALYCNKSSVLLRGKASKQYGDLYCLNCFYSFETEKKHKSH